MGTDRTAYRRHSEIWNFNKGMITKVDHAINSIRRRHPNTPPREVRVLDVGCGVATVSLPIAAAGYSVTAVDIDEPSIRFCRRKAHDAGIKTITFVNGLLQDSLAPDGSYDWVFLADVLEHMDEPVEFLALLRGYLKPGGHLWISVPNETSALSMTPLNLFDPYVRVKNGVRSLGKKTLKLLGLWKGLEKRRAGLPSDHAATRNGEAAIHNKFSSIDEAIMFSPSYFNYSLSTESNHVQWFTFNSIQEAVRSAGFEIASVHGGSLFYKCFPMYHIMDKFVLLSELDYKLAQLAPRWAGSWWLVCQVSSEYDDEDMKESVEHSANA